MSDFSSDINPPPEFDKDGGQIPVGYVGATTMPGKVFCG
jgi:hypothetical protein